MYKHLDSERGCPREWRQRIDMLLSSHWRQRRLLAASVAEEFSRSAFKFRPISSDPFNFDNLFLTMKKCPYVSSSPDSRLGHVIIVLCRLSWYFRINWMFYYSACAISFCRKRTFYVFLVYHFMYDLNYQQIK